MDLAAARKRFERDANTRSERGWRIMNGAMLLIPHPDRGDGDRKAF